MTMRTFVAAAALLTATAAVAEDAAVPPEAHMAYRHKLMESIGANMGAIGDILKNKMPHADNVAVHARVLQLSAGLIESAFRAEATDEESESLPVIWEKWEDFAAAAAQTEAAAGNLAEVAATGDMAAIGGAVRKLGQTCGACHRTFRKDE